MSEEPKPNTKSLDGLLGNESAQITFDNMMKLCNQKEYKIADVVYKRKILKPKELVELFKIQKQLDGIEDPEERMKNIRLQAEVCLEGITDDNWNNTDIVQMETVIGACLLIARGFRKI